MNIYPGAELWRRVYELGNQVGELWRLKHRSVKRTEKPSFPRCAYKTTDQPHGYPPCGRPAEHCETEPPHFNIHGRSAPILALSAPRQTPERGGRVGNFARLGQESTLLLK